MQTPGPLEIIVILVVALLVFGPTKLPEIGRQVGKAMREFKRFQAGFQDEIRDFVDPDKAPQKPWPATSAPQTQTQPAPEANAEPEGTAEPEGIVDAEIVVPDPTPEPSTSEPSTGEQTTT